MNLVSATLLATAISEAITAAESKGQTSIDLLPILDGIESEALASLSAAVTAANTKSA